MPECCGEERETPYCPECGTCLGRWALKTLCSYLSGHRYQMRQLVEQNEREVAAEPDSDVLVRCLHTSQQKLAKWQGWLDAVEELKQRAEAKEST